MSSYKNANTFLKNKAKENNWNFYSIIEDSYEYDNGLLLIGYEDEESMLCKNNNVKELGHICINIDNF